MEIPFTIGQKVFCTKDAKNIGGDFEIKKGEQYLIQTNETDLIFEYSQDQIVIMQNHELGFALSKWNIITNSYQPEYNSLDAGRIG